MTKHSFFIALLLFGTTAFASEGPLDQAVLEAKILELDTQLFNAVHAADMDKVKQFFHPDLEFYHDTGGLEGYEETMTSIERLSNSPNAPKRTLLKETNRVFPVPGFGAMQVGKHQFCHTNNQGNEDCGTFEFVHVWQRVDDTWRIKRVLSYAH